jgi:hypothetical protein
MVLSDPNVRIISIADNGYTSIGTFVIRGMAFKQRQKPLITAEFLMNDPVGKG